MISDPKKKVLIVEDNPISGEDFKRRLIALGYDVIDPLTKGEDVAKSVSRHKPDLILMDIRLKGSMNGIEAAVEVKRQTNIPIIYITAHADPDTIERAKKTEPYGYLVKPFDDRELQSSIEISLYRHQMERQLLESEQWLQTTLNSIGDGVIATDMEGKVTYINPIAQSLTGWSEKEALAQPLESVFTIVNEISGEPSENPVKKVIETGQVIGLANHTLLLSRDGRRIPIKDSGAPIQLNGEEQIGVVLVFQDDSESRKAEQKLLNSQRRLEEAQRIGKTGNWSWDMKSGEISWSDAMFQVFQINKQKITFELVKSTVHPDDLELWLKTVETAAHENEPFELEYRIKGKDGQTIWIRNKTTILDDEENSVFFGIAQDITTQKENEIASKNAENKLLEAQEFAKIGIWERDIHEDIVTWSDQHCKIYGIRPDESPFPYSRLLELIPEEYHNHHESQVEQLLQSGSAEFEYPVKRSDGQFQWVWAKGRLKKDSAGNPTHMFGFTQDISERKQTEFALKASEERFKAIYEHAPVLIDAFDKNGKCVLWNNECRKTFGWTIDEINAHGDALSLFYPDPDVRDEVIRTVTTDPDAQFREWHPKTKDGRTLDTMWANFALPDGLTFNIGYDITQRRELESRLLQAQKMESIGNFAGGIAHDFNNILSSVLGFTELALGNIDKDSAIREDLQEVYSAGLRAKELVQQILTFARQTDEELKPIQIDVIIKEVIKFIRSTTPTTIEIEHDITSDSAIIGNSTQIHRIMMNLCTNAADAMEKDGGILGITLKDITIDANTEKVKIPLDPGDYIVIKVSDTGEGIERNLADKIFEPYFTTKGQGEGTGLGLAMVHGIVESYRGKIKVDSSPGQGTVFTIFLPTVKRRNIPIPKEFDRLPAGKERILVVDDELPIAKMTSRTLNKLGYSVATASSGMDALELFTRNPDDFDLIISDVTMPHMSGDQLAKRLIKIRPNLPVILSTGYSKRLSEKQAFEIGVKAFIYKPIEKADLAKTVRQVLDSV